ncbi:MAG: hypothetical protein IRZ14_16825 [Chloroflexi bacterium]|nr:hypothetical protein [Chloroflexota bacterium]
MCARFVGVLVAVAVLLVTACAIPLGSAPPAGHPADAARPALPVAPAVDLKVGVLPMASCRPFFILSPPGRASTSSVLGHFTVPVDLGYAFDDTYRAFAVQYLGPYQPPR